MTEQSTLNKRDWIAGLEKGLRIIEAFSDTHSRLTSSTAARRTGITRTATRRYLKTLEYLGYVKSDGHYFWLTPKVLRLGWSYFDSAKIPRAVQPYLQRIGMALGGIAYFAVLDEDDVVFVSREGSSPLPDVGHILGARFAANLSSAGIALLSCSPPHEVEQWLAKRKLVPYTSFTTITEEGVREHISLARERGYAILEQQISQGMRGIAVAIRTREGEIAGAISVSLAMGSETSEAAIARTLPLLREAEYALLAAF